MKKKEINLAKFEMDMGLKRKQKSQTLPRHKRFLVDDVTMAFVSLSSRGKKGVGAETRWAENSMKRGVTLIEIMIVLAIIGLIAGGVAVVAVPKFRESQVKSARINLKSLHQIVEMYVADHSSECPSVTELKSKKAFQGDTNDSWGKAYKISCEGEEIVVRSNGPDGIAGNQDDLIFPEPVVQEK